MPLNNIKEVFLPLRRKGIVLVGAVGESWRNVFIRFELDGVPCTIRNLAKGDEVCMSDLETGLGEKSQSLFYPYPWWDKDELLKGFKNAVVKSVSGTDASYLIIHPTEGVIGHFFLWQAFENSHSLTYGGVHIPELGVAIVDRFQGHGLGTLAVELLKLVGKEAGAAAIELTTGFHNDTGEHVYRAAGFIHVGVIKNPVGADVLAVTDGSATATEFREERQMVLVLDETKREQVLDYLAFKRGTAGKT